MKIASYSIPVCLALTGCLLGSGAVNAGGFEEAARIHAGTFACGGNHFTRSVDVPEIHRTTYVFSNLSGRMALQIDRMRLFDANGNVLFDFPADSFPDSVRTELGPYQTTQINTADVLGYELPPEARPIQAQVQWSYEHKGRGVPPAASMVRTVRNGANGGERSRANSDCRLIEWRR